MPTASFSHSVEVDRPIDHVWARLQDAQTWANIGPVDEVWDATHDGRGMLESYRWSTRVGPTRYRGTAQVIESVSPTVMRQALDSHEVAGVLATTMTENGSGTSVTVHLDIRSVGMLSTMFFGKVAEAVQTGLPVQVERLATLVEDDG